MLTKSINRNRRVKVYRSERTTLSPMARDCVVLADGKRVEAFHCSDRRIKTLPKYRRFVYQKIMEIDDLGLILENRNKIFKALHSPLNGANPLSNFSELPKVCGTQIQTLPNLREC